jgi:hypothetical protein
MSVQWFFKYTALDYPGCWTYYDSQNDPTLHVLHFCWAVIIYISRESLYWINAIQHLADSKMYLVIFGNIKVCPGMGTVYRNFTRVVEIFLCEQLTKKSQELSRYFSVNSLQKNHTSCRDYFAWTVVRVYECSMNFQIYCIRLPRLLDILWFTKWPNITCVALLLNNNNIRQPRIIILNQCHTTPCGLQNVSGYFWEYQGLPWHGNSLQKFHKSCRDISLWTVYKNWWSRFEENYMVNWDCTMYMDCYW